MEEDVNKLLRAFTRSHTPNTDALSARLDGQLDEVARSALDVHLESCAVCQTQMAQLRSAREALRAMPQVAAPRSFRLRAADVERAQERRAYDTPAMRLVPALGAVTGIVLLVAGGIDLSQNAGGGGSSGKRAARAPVSGAMRDSATTTDKSIANSAPAASGATSGSAAASPLAGNLAPERATQPSIGVPGTATSGASDGGQAGDPAGGSPADGPLSQLSTGIAGDPYLPADATQRAQTRAPDAGFAPRSPTSEATLASGIGAEANGIAETQARLRADDDGVATAASNIFAASNRAQPQGNKDDGRGVIRSIEIVAGALAIAAAALTLFRRLGMKEETR